ncbi:protein FAR1-RELATED SEQUENCE 7-like [Telopea speciosissima]|uniref:protein FAR1-RELATED SEQUENCE 7-like n=1 Tax=Telopea speciosissima TaxID=54955 RepID=UPI001CC67C0F|nr:protein FAR1-RELATED SEQUENCE 7-like [Telopea speciosissima]
MENMQPKAIFTDQNPGIMRTIKLVFLLTVHRLCRWHLEKHRIQHMRALYKKYPDLNTVYRSCIYGSNTPVEFEERWECMRGELMNMYFKGFFTSTTPLNEFVTQFEEAENRRREKEAKKDAICITSSPSCATSHRIEQQAVNVYTNKVFKFFFEEWFACFGLQVNQCDDEIIEKRHILKIHVITDRSHIPDRYIMHRWTKAAQFSNTPSGTLSGSSQGQPQQPIWLLQDLVNKFAREGTLFEERFDAALKILNEGLVQVQRLQANVPSSSCNPEPSAVVQRRVNQSLRRSITRGPNLKRMVAGIETVTNRRGYHCSSCGGTDHNIQNCPMANTLGIMGDHTQVSNFSSQIETLGVNTQCSNLSLQIERARDNTQGINRSEQIDLNEPATLL